MMARSERKTVPQVFIGPTHIGGADGLQPLAMSGRLDVILAEQLVLPESFDPSYEPVLGMKVVRSLTTQLRGNFVVKPSLDGAHSVFCVEFCRLGIHRI